MMGDREIIRTSYGMSRPRIDFPKLANLYMNNKLQLDNMISMRLPLSSINDGFKALEEGKVARAIIEFWLENTYEKNYLSKRLNKIFIS